MSELAVVVDEKAPQESAGSLIEVIARAAMDPRLDVQKLQALLDMQIRIEARQAEVEFNAALARLMPRLPRIEKDGIIRDRAGAIRSKYARYEDIDLAIRPLLAEEGLAISFDTDDSTPKALKIIGTLSHRMGHSRKSHVTLPTESSVITGSQAIGATVSYGKRYIVMNLLNIICVGEDADGDDLKTITPEQVMNIQTLLNDSKANLAKFLKWAGVEKVEDILERDYRAVVKALEAKRRQ